MKKLLITIGLLFLVACVAAVNICPLTPAETPSELAFGAINYNVTNGGSTNGVIFAHSSTVSGVTGDITGYVSSSTNVLGVAGTIDFASVQGTDAGLYTSKVGVDMSQGRLIGSESVTMDYVTPNGNCDENSTYIPFCEIATSKYNVDLSNGGYGSTINALPLVSTNDFTHQSAVTGSGSYSASASIASLQGCNGTVEKYQFSSDRIGISGTTIDWARVVSYHSTR